MVRGAPALTERQEDVFAWLARNQKDGEVTARMNQICRDLKITDGTVFGHLYAIEKKGYIERLTGYNERVNGVRVSPRFKVLQAPEPEVVRLAKPLEKLPDAEPDDEYIKTLKDRRAKLESEIEKIDELIQFHHESARS